MNKPTRTFITAALLCLAAACNAPTTDNNAVQNIDIAAAHSLATEGNAIVLDVRTPEEYALSHIDGAVNIDIQNPAFAAQVAKLDVDKTYIVHCAANVENGRTAKALVIMADLGFDKTRNLTGGILAWEQNGQALVKPTATDS